MVSLAIPFSKHHFFQTNNQKALLFTVFSLFELLFSCSGERKPTLNTGHCFACKFSHCCDIQGSHLIGYLWVSLIIDQSECLVCYFLCNELTLSCSELTLFYTELPENCIYLNQSELSNFFPYIISTETTMVVLKRLQVFHKYWINFSSFQIDLYQSDCK